MHMSGGSGVQAVDDARAIIRSPVATCATCAQGAATCRDTYLSHERTPPCFLVRHGLHPLRAEHEWPVHNFNATLRMRARRNLDAYRRPLRHMS
jgi:hypothetical protein